MGDSITEFVHRENLKKFKFQLDHATTEMERKRLRALLTEEECKKTELSRSEQNQ